MKQGIIRSLRIGLATFMAVVLSGALPTGVAFAQTVGVQNDPPGNNGTVKVGDIDLSTPGGGNDPQIDGCTFEIKWIGFDVGNQASVVTFEKQSAAGDYALEGFTGDSIVNFVGSGPGNTVDYEEEYELNFDGTPEAQGYHVKLKVSTTGSQGNDTKSKVFWVDCEDDTDGDILATPTLYESTPTCENPSISVTLGGGVGVIWTNDDNTTVSPDEEETYSATAADGYYFAQDAKTSWKVENKFNPEDCVLGEVTDPKVHVWEVCKDYDETSRVIVKVTNPYDDDDYESDTYRTNEALINTTVTYTITIDDQEKELELEAGDEGKKVFEGLQSGHYEVKVTGSDGSSKSKWAHVFDCEDDTPEKVLATPTLLESTPNCEAQDITVTLGGAGVIWTNSDDTTVAPGEEETYTASAADGYYFASDATTSWTVENTFNPEDCVLAETDVCENIPGSQSVVPVGFERNTSGDCVAAGGQGAGEVLGTTTTVFELADTGEGSNPLTSLFVGLAILGLTFASAWLVRNQNA